MMKKEVISYELIITYINNKIKTKQEALTRISEIEEDDDDEKR